MINLNITRSMIALLNGIVLIPLLKGIFFWPDKKSLLPSTGHIFYIQWYKKGEVKNTESYISYEQ